MNAAIRAMLALVLFTGATGATGAAARHLPNRVSALAVQGTIFVGTVTCTLDNQYSHIETNAAGQIDKKVLQEHGTTTFVLVEGKPIIATGSYSLHYQTEFDSPNAAYPANSTVDTTDRTEQGSVSA